MFMNAAMTPIKCQNVFENKLRKHCNWRSSLKLHRILEGTQGLVRNVAGGGSHSLVHNHFDPDELASGVRCGVTGDALTGLHVAELDVLSELSLLNLFLGPASPEHSRRSTRSPPLHDEGRDFPSRTCPRHGSVPTVWFNQVPVPIGVFANRPRIHLAVLMGVITCPPGLHLGVSISVVSLCP